MSVDFSIYISKPLERELLIVLNSCLQILNSKLSYINVQRKYLIEITKYLPTIKA